MGTQWISAVYYRIVQYDTQCSCRWVTLRSNSIPLLALLKSSRKAAAGKTRLCGSSRKSIDFALSDVDFIASHVPERADFFSKIYKFASAEVPQKFTFTLFVI